MRDSVLVKSVLVEKFRVTSGPALLVLFAAFLLIAACGRQTSAGTPTPRLAVAAVPTVPPSVIEREQIAVVFAREIAHISDRDWEAIYNSCTVDFRNRRDLETFVEQAEDNFFRQGYSYQGFEARNIVITSEPRDRVSVTYDAYENGEFIRTVTPDGGAFVLIRGEWIDDGINCRTSNRPAILP